MKKKVSVIIPIYKGNSFISHLAYMLEENWETINKIEMTDIEMILVNDFPSEKLEIKEQWVRNISWTVISNKQNSGIHFSRVQGLLHATGEYILFLDQDDEISPVYIREQMQALGSDDAIICNGKNRGNLIYRNEEVLRRAVEEEEYRREDNLIVSPGQVLLRKSSIPIEWVNNILTRNGADDYFLWFLMFCQKKKIKIQDKVLYWHLISDINTSKNTDEMYSSVLEMLSKMQELGYISSAEAKHIEEIRNNRRKPEIISDEKYMKQKRYKQILDAWLTLRERKITVDVFLTKKSIKRIAIYGGGMLGQHLYYELKETNITVVCFLDQNRKVDISGIKTIVPGDPMEMIDAIIITPIIEYESIQEQLKQQYDVNMISLETIIYNADCELMME